MKKIKVDTEKYSELQNDTPEMIILHHFTRYENPRNEFQKKYNTVEKIVDFLSTSDYQVSCNAVVDTNGDLYSIVPKHLASWHAGKSILHGKHVNYSVNKLSYGIEIIRSQENEFEYTSEQYLTVASLLNNLMLEFDIIPPYIASHKMIRDEYNQVANHSKETINSAQDKNDPLHWDWKLMYELVYTPGIPKYLSVGDFKI